MCVQDLIMDLNNEDYVFDELINKKKDEMAMNGDDDGEIQDLLNQANESKQDIYDLINEIDDLSKRRDKLF